MTYAPRNPCKVQTFRKPKKKCCTMPKHAVRTVKHWKLCTRCPTENFTASTMWPMRCHRNPKAPTSPAEQRAKSRNHLIRNSADRKEYQWTLEHSVQVLKNSVDPTIQNNSPKRLKLYSRIWVSVCRVANHM